MEPVGVGPRALAIIIDTLIAIVVIVPLSLVLGYHTGIQALLGLLVLVYFVVMEATQGGTLGKKAMGLRIVKQADGAAISWTESLIRNVLRLIDGFFFYLVGAIIVWVSKNKQRLGDIAAGTIVVRKGA
jgi:uncharacterized RDD family membrane protein YckC